MTTSAVDRPSGPQAPGTADAPGTDSSGSTVSVGTMILFLIGCAILVLAAMNLNNLGRWADEYGQVPVVLCFFLIMGLGGRWLWSGIDAIIAAVRASRKTI